jgi:conjugative relaxase-like TrwC/TraI family protein
VLRVARVRDPTGRYYLSGLDPELDAAALGTAAAGPSPPSARWLGAGASGLALSGRVEAAPLAAVLSGRHPIEGHRLRTRESAVRAYDLMFAAPKTASVLFALGTPDAARALRDAHEEAIDAAVGYVAGHAAVVRHREPGGRTSSTVDGLVAAAFTHCVSRALDPHLHSHVVVANLARGDDGRWRAIDGRGLYAHARAAGALYDAVLRHGVVARLGLEWSPRHPSGWELSVVDPVLAGALSARRAEILAELEGHARRKARAGADVGPSPAGGAWASSSSGARAVAWAVTRDPKTRAPSPGELRARWTKIARDSGFGVELEAQAPARRAARGDVDEHRFAAAICEPGHRGVARRDAIRAWALAIGTGAPAESIAGCVDALWDWGNRAGVGETLHPPAAVIPRSHVLRTLGPRPSSPERLSVWLSAASSIHRYCARWEVRDGWNAPGGGRRSELAAMPARRLADHLSTARAIDEAMAALGRRRELERRRDVARGLVRDGG